MAQKNIPENHFLLDADDFEFQGSLFEDLGDYEITDTRRTSCFFTGHRKIAKSVIPTLIKNLNARISQLYRAGITEFYTGGALGFDTLAAMQVIDIKRHHADMHLHLKLPYPTQSERWASDQKRIYEFVMEAADTTEYISDVPPKGMYDARKHLLSRNDAMINAAHTCVAYFSGKRGGTAYTIERAKKVGCEIINLYQNGLF